MPKNYEHLLNLSDGKKLIFLGVIFLVISLFLFWNSISGSFIYDDHLVLSNSLFTDSGDFLKFLVRPYFEDYPQGGLYRPVTQMSFALNFALGGNDPRGFHVFNIILHAANTFLIFILMKRWLGSFRVAVAAASLFAVLPIHSEAVASIVGRGELLAFGFSLGSLILWFRKKYILSVILFFAGVLSKETALIVPAVVLTQILYERSWSSNWRNFSYYFLALGGYAALRIYVLGEYAFRPVIDFVFNPLVSSSFMERLSGAGKILSLQLKNTFTPSNLSPDYSYSQISIPENLFSSGLSLLGFSIILLAVILGAYFIRSRGNHKYLVGIIMFMYPYLMVSNLFNSIGTLMADRLMYMPSLGLVIFPALLIDSIAGNIKYRRAIAVVLGIVVGIYSSATIAQNKIWLDERSFFEAMFTRSPDSIVAQTNWARIILPEDRERAKSLIFQAYSNYQDFVPTLNLMAKIEREDGRPNEAIKYLERAVSIQPKNQETLTELSRLYFILKRYRQADAVLGILVPEYGGSGNVVLYAITNIRVGDYEKAIKITDLYRNLIDPESASVISDYSSLKLSKNYQFSAMKKAETDLAELEKLFTD